MNEQPGVRFTHPDGAYADRLTVVFRAIDHPSSDNDIGPSVVMALNPEGSLLDLEAIRHELERLAAGPEMDRSYIATQKYGHTSWGADGASALFWLAVGGQVAGQFICDGLREISRAIRDSVTAARPITEREAKFWGEVMVTARFENVDRQGLVVTSTKLGAATAEVGFSTADGSTFHVKMELADGLVAVGEVERTYPGTA